MKNFVKSMSNLKILIIVPTLNTYKILDKLVNSLKSQKYKHWRVVFVDASKDKNQIIFFKKLSNHDSRFSWVLQNEIDNPGIYGAMNQGLESAKSDEWILFWGSDDYAPNKETFDNLAKEISFYKNKDPYILIGRARYIDIKNLKLGRRSFFIERDIVLNSVLFSLYMFLGFSPPHQGTIFSPDSIKGLKIFNTKFKIASDLNYFLNISLIKGIKIPILECDIVNIGEGGYSSLSNRKRLIEVFVAYYERFQILAFIPFIFRYFKRLLSVLKK